MDLKKLKTNMENTATNTTKEYTLEECISKLMNMFKTHGSLYQGQRHEHKSELCASWLEGHFCSFYPECHFAHGWADVKARIYDLKSFKVHKCLSDKCKYTTRCQFFHDDIVYTLTPRLRVFYSKLEKMHRISLGFGNNGKLKVISLCEPVNPERCPYYQEIKPVLESVYKIVPATSLEFLNQMAKETSAFTYRPSQSKIRMLSSSSFQPQIQQRVPQQLPKTAPQQIHQNMTMAAIQKQKQQLAAIAMQQQIIRNQAASAAVLHNQYIPTTHYTPSPNAGLNAITTNPYFANASSPAALMNPTDVHGNTPSPTISTLNEFNQSQESIPFMDMQAAALLSTPMSNPGTPFYGWQQANANTWDTISMPTNATKATNIEQSIHPNVQALSHPFSTYVPQQMQSHQQMAQSATPVIQPQPNTFGTFVQENPIGTYAQGNPIGTYTQDNPIGTYAQENSIGTYAQENPIGMYAQENLIGTYSQENLIGKYAQENPIGSHVNTNSANQCPEIPQQPDLPTMFANFVLGEEEKQAEGDTQSAYADATTSIPGTESDKKIEFFSDTPPRPISMVNAGFVQAHQNIPPKSTAEF